MCPVNTRLFFNPTLGVFSSLVTVVFLALIQTCKGQSVIGLSQPIVALVGDDIILPCSLDPAMDVFAMTVEWARFDLDPRFVLVWRDGDELKKKNPSYKGRTSLFRDELKQGNISLKLTQVKLSDEGTYRCYLPGLDRYSHVQLVIGSTSTPVIQVIKNASGVVFQCKSRGWYPEPEVLWLDSEGNLLSGGPTETVRGSDDLYTVSSRVTVEKRNNYNITCKVQQNHINQTRETQIHVSDNLFIVSTTSSKYNNIIGWAVGAFVFLLFLLAVVFVVWKRRKNKFRKNMKSLEDGSNYEDDTKLNPISDKAKIYIGKEEEEEGLIAGREELNNVHRSEKNNTCQAEHKDLQVMTKGETNQDQVLTNIMSPCPGDMDRKEEHRTTTTVITERESQILAEPEMQQAPKTIEGQGEHEGEQKELVEDSRHLVADGGQLRLQMPLDIENAGLEEREGNKDAKYNNDHEERIGEQTEKKRRDQEENKQQKGQTQHMQQKTERQEEKGKTLQSDDDEPLKAEKENNRKYVLENKKTAESTPGYDYKREDENQRDRIESTAEIQNVENNDILKQSKEDTMLPPQTVKMEKQSKEEEAEDTKKKQRKTENRKKEGKTKEHNSKKQAQVTVQSNLEEAKQQQDGFKKEHSQEEQKHNTEDKLQNNNQQGSAKLVNDAKRENGSAKQKDFSVLKESKNEDQMKQCNERGQIQRGVMGQENNTEVKMQKNNREGPGNKEQEDNEPKPGNTKVKDLKTKVKNQQDGTENKKKDETIKETEQQEEQKAQNKNEFEKEQSQGRPQEEVVWTNKAVYTEETQRKVKEVDTDQQQFTQEEPMEVDQEPERKLSGIQKETRKRPLKAVRSVNRKRVECQIEQQEEQMEVDVIDSQSNVSMHEKRKHGHESCISLNQPLKRRRDEDEIDKHKRGPTKNCRWMGPEEG